LRASFITYRKSHVAYISNGRVIGLSKMNRIVEYYSKKTTGTRALDDANRSGITKCFG
jgi:GTP cyclohydrolase I